MNPSCPFPIVSTNKSTINQIMVFVYCGHCGLKGRLAHPSPPRVHLDDRPTTQLHQLHQILWHIPGELTLLPCGRIQGLLWVQALFRRLYFCSKSKNQSLTLCFAKRLMKLQQRDAICIMIGPELVQYDNVPLERLQWAHLLEGDIWCAGELVTWFAVLWLCNKNLTSITPQQKLVEMGERGDIGVDQLGVQRTECLLGGEVWFRANHAKILSIRRIHSTQQHTKDTTTCQWNFC
jgi:hypothetical protein